MAMPELSRQVRRHYRDQQHISRATARAILAMWRNVDPDNISASWQRQIARAAAVLSAGQEASAKSASTYIATLPQLSAPEYVAAPAAFAGQTAGGGSLAGLLYNPVVTSKLSILQGNRVTDALHIGQSQLGMLVLNEVQQAGRNAAGVGITVFPEITGYTRVLTTPSCPRCIVLAGKWYRWSSGFARHPRCFPAGVVTSGPKLDAASRRWFEGELVVLTTASGEKLPLTGNHPVLTSRGWVPAHLLNEGDDVVRSTHSQGAEALIVPDHDQVPSLVEDVWRSFSVNGLDRVPTTAEDFHGDGQRGEVDIVRADSTLGSRFDSALGQHLGEHPLTVGLVDALALSVESAPQLRDLRYSAHTGGAVGGSGLGLSLLEREMGIASQTSIAHATRLDASFGQDAVYRTTRDAVLAGEPVHAGAGFVGGDNRLDRENVQLARWDAPGDSFTVETASGYAARGCDLLSRLTGQVELDRIVELRRVQWSGHVYSLSSSEGWHTANSLIVSNCDCLHKPDYGSRDRRNRARPTDPQDYFDSMTEEEQNATFGKPDAQAIRDGADMSQVVNAHGKANTYTFEVDGVKKRATRAGSSVQYAWAGRQMALADRQLLNADGSFNWAADWERATRPRLTVGQIYKDAGGNREKALAMLREYGYADINRGMRRSQKDLLNAVRASM
jgi:hypothetical protein